MQNPMHEKSPIKCGMNVGQSTNGYEQHKEWIPPDNSQRKPGKKNEQAAISKAPIKKT